jgi:long-chain fatty acid transport protein
MWLQAFVGATTLLWAGVASANGFEFPSNGTEQFGRGSAWLARASDPLATFYNPAALARNGNGISVTANVIWQKNCFDRSFKNPTTGQTDQVQVSGSGQGQIYGQVCNDVSPFPNPQVAFQYRLSEKLGIGIAILGPSAAGKMDYPATTTNTSTGLRSAGQPADGPPGSRYIVTNLNSLIVWPQIGIGYEVARNLRIGASFIWGISSIEFKNVSLGLNASQSIDKDTGRLNESADQDLSAKVTAKDWFIPGFTASVLYSIGDSIDVAGWFHWSDAVHAKGEASITSFYYERLQLSSSPNTDNTPKGQTSVDVPQPWDAKIGVRYHVDRPVSQDAQAPGGFTVKDPLRDEVFDIEIDGEFSHDSQFKDLGVHFAGADTSITPGGATVPLANVPRDATIPHHWKDAYGVRLGGDYNVIPSKLALRAGAWFQSSTIDPQYMHLDFVSPQRLGLTVGGTVRLSSFDVQFGYGHIFAQTIDNNGDGAIRALSGQALSDPPNRSTYGVNGGKITSTTNIVSLGVVYRWQ